MPISSTMRFRVMLAHLGKSPSVPARTPAVEQRRGEQRRGEQRQGEQRQGEQRRGDGEVMANDMNRRGFVAGLGAAGVTTAAVPASANMRSAGSRRRPGGDGIR